jgi:hypothetical protein
MKTLHKFIAPCSVLLVYALNFSPACAAPIPGVTPVNGPALCNSVDFHQIPGNPSYFIGRRLLNTGSDLCSGSNWTLALFQMDWTSNTITYLHDVLTLPVSLPAQRATVQSAYDPTMVQYNRELWVAFECYGSGLFISGPASSCIAPFTLANGIDPSRMTLVVHGIPKTSSTDGYSASVPKIFLYQNALYLYWSVSHFQQSIDGVVLTDTTTRGAQLTQETSGLRRMWATGFVGTAMPSHDPGYNYEVLGLGSDALSNGVADSFEVYVLGNQLLLMAAVGGQGCTTPVSPVYGCYRFQIFSSTSALGTHVFSEQLQSPGLPFNPQEYSKIITDPSGNQFVMCHCLQPTTTGSAEPDSTIPTVTVMTRYPIATGSLVFGTADPTPGPNPTDANNTLATTFSVLHQFVLSCSATNAVANPNDGACFSAVHRYCQSQGYELGGLLEEYSAGNAIVACARSSHGSTRIVNIGALSAYQPSCTFTNLISDSCASAINRYCLHAGYGGGGFGPMEYLNNNVMIECVDNQAFSQVATTISNLVAHQPLCSVSWTSSVSCYSAANRVCNSLGYISGYGILEHYQNAAVIGCIRGGIPN